MSAPRRRLIDQIGASPTFVAEGCRLTGDLETTGSLVVCGTIRGDVSSLEQFRDQLADIADRATKIMRKLDEQVFTTENSTKITTFVSDLQGVAESLNTKCAGRAWVFVTSQEDMDKVVGDRTKQQGNDFSKIQARFKTRVKLTSADVEEVIRSFAQDVKPLAERLTGRQS